MLGKSMALLLAGLAFSSPFAAAHVDPEPDGSTQTTLFFHIFDTFNAFPINTQAPDTEFFRVGGTNFVTLVDDSGLTETNYDFNTVYGFATSGPVEYDFIENGQPRFHPERGIARTVAIDRAAPVTTFLYLDVRDVVGRPDGLPNYLPSLTFRVTMREGNQVGPDADLDAGVLIMQGELTAHVWDDKGTGLPAPPMPGLATLTPDDDGVVEFAIPMTLEQAAIPKANAYHVRIDWFQNPTGDRDYDDQFAEGYMRLVSDAEHHPRMEMAITNPVYIEAIHPEVAAGILLIHTCVNSPWGTYDVDVENMTLEVLGPTVPADMPVVVAQGKHGHGDHDKCAEVTYLWRFRDQGAAVGEYRIHLHVQNMAHTATAGQEAAFVVGEKAIYTRDDQGREIQPIVAESTEAAPGPSLLVVAVLLAGAVLARRRRA